MKSGDRSKVVTAAVNNKIKEKYGFKLGDPYLTFFKNFTDEALLTGSWEYTSVPTQDNKVIFTIGGKEAKTFNDFAKYLDSNQSRRMRFKTLEEALVSYFEAFERESLKKFYQNQLEKEDEKYAAIISEYRDGLLIFDLMRENIWNKAKKDTVGQQRFFDNNRAQYSWDERVSAIIVNATSQQYADQAKEMLQQGKDAKEIKEALNDETGVKAIVTEGKFELSDKNLPDGFVKKEGVSQTYVKGTTYTVVKVLEILPPMQKSLDDVRGRVLSDFQIKVEEDWIESLRNKYDVSVNKKTLKKLKKKLDK